MNRILFRPEEIDADGRVTFGGVRAAHVIDVLHGTCGMTLKTGVYDGAIGSSVIEGVVATAYEVSIKVAHDAASPRPLFDLVLAMPRPRVFKRMLPQITAMGLGRLYVVGAEKVEKSYWGAGCLTEKEYRGYLEEGLMQSGTSLVPEIIIARDLKKLLVELDISNYRAAYIAHPYGETANSTAEDDGQRVLIAVGPEGGWTDQEVVGFRDKGFLPKSLGARILKTETATIALIAQLCMR